MARMHKDVEYAVDDAAGRERTFRTFQEAAAFAVVLAASGRRVFLDVLIWSEAGANAFGGRAGVERYREDPDASVFERIEIRAESQGRVP